MVPLSLYIHWPFCVSKCPYCDFNSHVQRRISEENWQSALEKELKRLYGQTEGRPLKTIFFGGGTPSLMHPKTVEHVIQTAQKLWGFTPNIEITLEANPNSVEAERFKAFRQAGINRISVGIQALNDHALKALGRQHNAIEAIQAIEVACHTFDRVSFDLIYGRPGQTLADWQAELNEALQFGTTHLSLYQLTIEPGTAFATLYQRGELVLPHDDVLADMYEFTQITMNNHNMPAYEVSNHALAGHESQHNLTYWRYEDYVGVGPGAHGRLTMNEKKYAMKQKRAPESWYQAVQQGCGDDEIVELTLFEQSQEVLMMGLRLQEGVSLDRVKHAINLDKMRVLENSGFLTSVGDKIQCTPQGRACLNAVLKELMLEAV